MFASTASTSINPSSFTVPNRATSRAISVPTVLTGALIASAIGGRFLAWTSGGATVAQLIILLMIALLAVAVGSRANANAAVGSLDARLARLAMRGGGVQTALATITLGIAVF